MSCRTSNIFWVNVSQFSRTQQTITAMHLDKKHIGMPPMLSMIDILFWKQNHFFKFIISILVNTVLLIYLQYGKEYVITNLPSYLSLLVWNDLNTPNLITRPWKYWQYWKLIQENLHTDWDGDCFFDFFMSS